MSIDGIRVLSQETTMESQDFVWIIAGVLIGLFFIFVIVSISLTDSKWSFIVCIISGSLAFLWIIIAGVCCVFDKPSDRNTYKCIFDEDVSIQEVYDNYDIVGRDGDIWVLKDKE